MTAADWIDDLERKAKAATPGPWSADGYGSGQQVTGAAGTIFADTLAFHEDAEFIAAANPATILRLIEQLRQERVCYTDECGEPCRSHVALLWAERDTARKKAGLIGQRLGKARAERDVLAARLAAVEALADETERAGDPLLRLDRLRAALSTAPTDTTKETDR